jgi:O-antigen/teichoic acid export membrane protein
VIGAGLAVWFVVRLQRGVAGVLYGRLFGDAVAALLAVVLVRHMLRLRFSADTLRRMLAFGVPMLPALFAFAAISGVDRYLLQRTRTLEEVAVYAVAMKFFTVMIFTASAFQLAYGPFAYARAGTPEAPRLYSRALSLYLTIGSTGALLVGLFAPEALRLLLPPVYAGAAGPALVLGFAAVGFGAYTVVGIGINLALRTAWASLCAATGALAAVVANLIWTPLHGPMGAAAATWIGYVTAALACYVVAQRFTPLPYRGVRLLALFLLANAAALAGQRIDLGGAMTIVAKLAVLAAFAALAARTAFLPVPAPRAAAAQR